MTNAERARRFKEARTELNPHGAETQAQVYAATGVSASAISNLENPESGRVPSSEIVNKLAEYYQVNSAWLTGQASSPSLNENSQTLTNVIGFSPRAAEKLVRLMAEEKNRRAINELIESDRFERMLLAITRLSDIPQKAPEGSWNADTIDYTEVVRKYAGDDSPVAFSFAEGDMQDMLIWKAQREMDGLIREVTGK